ncbi:MAG: hypothetical protein CVV62_02525 [Tenericutes bacterium HGW-Tenericutes-7]|nr:MAG: hypothetical protein CVV62_02525 [Tenericutes bacterium HGW-Tenericutes-7]
MKDFYKKLTDVIFVNLLWILGSFLGLLITMGASTTAMFRVTFQLLKKSEPTNVFHTFYKSFKENFVVSTLVWLTLVLLGFCLFMMYNYALHTDAPFLIVLAIVGGYQILIFTIYFFPVLAIFETKNVKQLIKNVLYLSNKNLWTNFKLLGSLAFVVLGIVFIHEMLILVLIGVYGVLISFHLKKVFDPYLRQFGEIDDEEGNY